MMKLIHLLLLATHAYLATCYITWFQTKADDPTPDELDAYKAIKVIMDQAIDRYNRVSPEIPGQNIEVLYQTEYQSTGSPEIERGDPGDPASVREKECNHGNGCIKFYGNRKYFKERVGLYVVAHVLGVGTTPTWLVKCVNGNGGLWPNTLKLLRSFDGPDAVIYCDKRNFWPYGMNFDGEFDERSADRHVKMVASFISEGLLD